MKKLSARRRHPLAAVVVLLLALAATGGLYAAFAPAGKAQADETAQSLAIEEGKKLYAVGCASCHGTGGQGTSDGPSVVGVGAAAVDFQVSTGRMPMARPGPQAPVKPNLYSDEEIAALAAYVASLGPGPAIPEPAQFDTANLSAEDLARGGELFRTNCSACHNFEGAGGALPGGKYAPPLKGLEPERIYLAMLTGPQQMPVFDDEVLTPDDKRAIIGYLEDLHSRPTDGGLGLGGLGPVSEGLWAWIIGLGGLIFFAMWIAAKGAKAK